MRNLPSPFIMRRLHSLMGLWLVIYLVEHLFVNAQAALFFKDHGSWFIASVNKIHQIPYLKLIESLFLAFPFLIHGIWGMYYAWTSKLNAHSTSGTTPALGQFKRNRAFSWQRITAWLLVLGILAHVLQMRFIDYPRHVEMGGQSSYMVRIQNDQKLPFVAQQISATLEKSDSLKPREIIAITPNIGGAFFLVVRDTFKSPAMVVLYSFLVVGATYHAFNGVWTFCITWGLTLSRRSQNGMKWFTNFLMGIVMFLGLIAIWGIYFGG